MSEQRDKNLWIFNAGNSFAGNPKWMFEYIIRHHKEIKPVWMCYNADTMNYVHKLGYEAELYHSSKGKSVMAKAGVYVVEMCKEVFQPELSGITVLNLWHGVGCKSIERKVTDGFLQERIAKKYIQNNDILRNNQLFLVTSEIMEKHFKEQCGIDDDKVIRAGYPRCVVNDDIQSYDHDIRKKKGLSANTKLAIYCPTYRDNNGANFMKSALPDMKRLADVLHENNILLILKMHPMVEKDTQYLAMKETYQNHPNFYFWENEDDVYEIFSDIDIAIIDYSSIFYDLLARGVKTFIRYFYDIDDKENFRDFVFDVREMTCGTEASNFDELLAALPAKRRRKQNSTGLISYSGHIRMKMTANGLLIAHFLSRRKKENFRNFTVSIFLIPCFHVSAVILPAFSTMSEKNWSSPTVAMTAILSANFRRFAAGAKPMCVSFIKSRY